MWGEMGVQTDPFPEKLNIPYTSIIWESINKNGGAADYTTEIIINSSEVKHGQLCYGPKKYGTLFLVEVTSVNPETISKLYDFVSNGGRIFCIEKYPEKSLGLLNNKERDKEVLAWVEKLKTFPDRFILVKKPQDNSFLEWYKELMTQYTIPHYLKIENPHRFVMQTRYQSDDKNEIIFFANAHMHNGHKTKITFAKEIINGRYGWVWDTENGKQYRIDLKEGSMELDLGPAESRMIIFNNERKGPKWDPIPTEGTNSKKLNSDWVVELHHSREGWVKKIHMDELKDLKDTEFVNFTGTVIYRHKTDSNEIRPTFLNLGKVWGISEVFVNGKNCGVKWYGYRIYNIADYLQKGSNEIEIRVTTTMGNYMKTLVDNKTAQKYTVLKTNNQPIQSMGLLGPVTLY
jgi:hypothetical protein